jgi:hypothetical protein
MNCLRFAMGVSGLAGNAAHVLFNALKALL